MSNGHTAIPELRDPYVGAVGVVQADPRRKTLYRLIMGWYEAFETGH
jgi:hypothetical protein